MIKYFKFFLFSKITPDFLNTFLNQGFKLISGPLLLLLLPTFINEETQGYWFSFMSLSSLSALADMGFTVIILQFSAHEYAYLKVRNNFFYPRDHYHFIHLLRLATLLKFILKWSFTLVLITFPIILIFGFKLFNSNVKFSWEIPWILFVIGSAINFYNNVFLSFFEGCDNVSKTQKIRFINSVIYFGILFIFLVLGQGLFALAYSILISSILTFFFSYIKFKFTLHQLIRINKLYKFSWLKEFWQYFSKYGFSVAIGYMTIQLYTPLVFKFYGAEASGKVGLTMSLVTAIFSIGNIWFQSIAPKFNILSSEKKWHDLDSFYNRMIKNTVYTYSFVCFCFVFSYVGLKMTKFDIITHRFLPLSSILVLMGHWFIQNFTYGYGFYLRSFKREPFLKLSIYNAILFLLLTFFMFRYFNVEYVFFVHLITSIIIFPFAAHIFNKKKKLWTQV